MLSDGGGSGFFLPSSRNGPGRKLQKNPAVSGPVLRNFPEPVNLLCMYVFCSEQNDSKICPLVHFELMKKAKNSHNIYIVIKSERCRK